MNFVETLQKLYSIISEITVYARNAVNHVDGESFPCIGLRSYFAGYRNNDPIIDGCSFMICGDIFFSNGKKVEDVRDVNDIWTCDPDFFVKLRAVSLTYPSATIDIGEYGIDSKSELDENQTVTLNLTRLG